MKSIDVRGKVCPEPLIITKRAIRESQPSDTFEIVLDNDIATCNLEGLLNEMKISFRRVDEGGISKLYFSVEGEPPTLDSVVEECAILAPKVANGGYIVVISSCSMGSEDELGLILMRGFINSLAEQDTLPTKIVLYNSGVKICVEGTDTAKTLTELTAKGVEVVMCGVCIDYFGVRESLATGRISNMYEITNLQRTANHIVYP